MEGAVRLCRALELADLAVQDCHHACIDFLETRPARSLPTEAGPPSDPSLPPAPPPVDAAWLTPAPDDLFTGTPRGPEARYSEREGVALAFLAAAQLLPPKQRAVLLLRDVLGWQAAEVAELLELTVAAVNSALQRARATLETKARREPLEAVMRPDERTRSLLERYVRAWEEADVNGLVSLLREDAAFAMPPMPSWYRGRDDIRAFASRSLLAGDDARGRYRLRPTAANGSSAVAIYVRDADGPTYRALAIQLVEIDGDQIASITSFMDPSLFARFALPDSLDR